MDQTFIVRRKTSLRALPYWLKKRRYTVSTYNEQSSRRQDRVIALRDGTEPRGEVVCMNPNLFPDALIAVLHGQRADKEEQKYETKLLI